MVELLTVLALMMAPINPTLSEDLQEMSEKIVEMEAEAEILAESLPPAEDHPLTEVIECESGGDPTAQNPISTASGLYQFVDGTWEYTWEGYIGESPPTEKAKYATEAEQHRAGRALYENEGLVPWYASRNCWERP